MWVDNKTGATKIFNFFVITLVQNKITKFLFPHNHKY